MAISYTEDIQTFQAVDVGWQPYTINATNGIPKGAVVHIALTNDDLNNGIVMGVRTDGSALDRYVDVSEGEQGGRGSASMLVTVDASSGEIDIYVNQVADAYFIIIEYWEGVTFTEEFSALADPTNNWVWDDNISVSTASRVYQILMGNSAEGNGSQLGCRTPGSGLNRHKLLHEAEGGGDEWYTNFCKSDGDAEIGLMASRIGGDDKFYSLGYFDSDMDYADLWVAKDVTAAWEDHDLTADLDEDGRVVSMICMHSSVNAEIEMGCRTNGSGLTRIIDEHEAEPSNMAGFCMCARTDSSGIIELYCENTAEDEFHLSGYFIFEEVAPPSAPPSSLVTKMAGLMVEGVFT